MSVLSVTDAGFQGNLKTYYTRFREDLFPLLVAVFAQFQKIKAGGPRNVTWQGRGVTWNVVSSDPVGWTYDQSGALPPSNFRGSEQASEGIRRMYVRQQFDRLANFATKGSGAFITLGQQIDEEMRLKFRLGLEEGLHGDGRGIKATVTNVVNTTTIDIANPYGITDGGQGALWVAQGMQIAVYDSAMTTKNGTAVVSSVTLQTAPDTYRIVLDAAIAGMSAGDVIVGAARSDSSSLNAHINGLTNIFNRGGNYSTGSTKLHNLETTAAPRWDTVRLTAGTDTARSDALDEPALYELCLRVAAKGESAFQSPNDFIIVTTTGLKKSYLEGLAGRLEGIMAKKGGRELAGGYGYDASFNGIPIIDSPYCPVGTVYLIHLPSIGWVDRQDFAPVSHEDAPAMRFVDGYDHFETSNAIFFNIITTKRSAHGMITGYTDTKRYSPLAA